MLTKTILTLAILSTISVTAAEPRTVARAEGDRMQIGYDGTWRDFFVRGVNLGVAQPGKWFPEFPADKATYARWLDGISRLNANTVRLYTLLDPLFYVALREHNERHPERPLWLMQEIWPDEVIPHDDFLDPSFNAWYDREIDRAVDAVHAARLERWLLGFLVGRELLPDEVKATNRRHPGFTFEGRYFASRASPTEAWLARAGDRISAREQARYGWQTPVGFVSWPTLDPVEHDSEWNPEGDKTKEFNDSVSVDIARHLVRGPDSRAGFFGAYHIYPNYPDFMFNEPGYHTYHDDEGLLLYGGYLAEFIAGHRGVPAIVAEVGLATGMGQAHLHPQGYDHGGHTEGEQGRKLVRLLKAIKREGYAGEILFAWMDEWAKKTWLTAPFMIPYERKVLWHNVVDPEQNYGLVANEPPEPPPILDASPAPRVEWKSNEAYLYLDVVLTEPVANLRIALDTVDRDRGGFRFGNLRFASGMEFIVKLDDKVGSLLALPDYDVGQHGFTTRVRHDGVFRRIRRQVNRPRVTKSGKKIPGEYEEASDLRYGGFEENAHHWYVDGNRVRLRLPWARLNVTDPSRHAVLDDPRVFPELPKIDEVRVSETTGIVATVFDASGRVLVEGTKPYRWGGWSAPRWRERFKRSYFLIREYWRSAAAR